MPESYDPLVVELPPSASCPEDCAVGPTEIEISDPSSFVFWGHDSRTALRNVEIAGRNEDIDGNDSFQKKRKRCADNCDRGEHDATTEPSHKNHSNNDSSSFRRAIGTFLSSGCCVIDKPVLPKHFVQTCLDRAKADHNFLKGLIEKEREKLFHNNGNDQHHYNRHHRMVALTRQDYSEWVARDGGRVDVRYGSNGYPYNCGGLIYNSIVFPLVKALLNGEGSIDTEEPQPLQLLYAGVMWGMPIGECQQNDDDNDNSPCSDHHQKWHADGGHLFSPHQLPEGLTLPPHCINVFYPLVDLKKENGPTEFRIGSHRRDSSENNNTENNVEFPLLCPAGSAVLFDYRIQHRGRANELKAAGPLSNIDNARPVLYLAYAKTYFKDHGNTRSGRRLVQGGTASLWATRTLEGRPVPYGKGFEDYSWKEEDDNNGEENSKKGNKDNKDTDHSNKRNAQDIEQAATTITKTKTKAISEAKPTTAVNNDGVGERWILFQMTLELPDDKSEVLRVHKGDVAIEVAQQFCFKHGLQDDFVSALAQTIQGQMDGCCG